MSICEYWYRGYCFVSCKGLYFCSKCTYAYDFRSLQFILAELHDYHSKQEQWLKLQEKLVWEQAPLDIRLLGQGQNSLLNNRGKYRLIIA